MPPIGHQFSAGYQSNESLKGEPLKLLCATWNVGESEPSVPEISHMLRDAPGADIVVVATQENEYVVKGSSRAKAAFSPGKHGTGVPLTLVPGKLSLGGVQRIEHWERLLLSVLNGQAETGASATTLEKK